MFDFLDFIEYVYDNPYDYVFRKDIHNPKSMEHVKSQSPSTTNVNKGTDYKEHPGILLAEDINKETQTRQQKLQSREQHLHPKNQQNDRRRINLKESKRRRTICPYDGNHRKISNIQHKTTYKRKGEIEELKQNIEEIMKKYNVLERKCNSQQKKIYRLEHTCGKLKTELNILKSQNSESDMDGTELVHETKNSSSDENKDICKEDPLGVSSQCDTSTEVKEEDLVAADPLSLDSQVS